MSELKHIVEFERGHDCRKFKCINDSDRCYPGSGGFHGIAGLKIRFVSKGDEGAVQFLLTTPWLPQFALNSIGGRQVRDWGDGNTYPMDLGYHSRKPRYDEQTSMGACEYCDGDDCYYDGSGLNADDAMYALVNGGSEALWSFLDSYYDTVFNDGPYPAPAEYVKELREPE